jgi:myo-inositol-1(or 4)-monophosphatase
MSDRGEFLSVALRAAAKAGGVLKRGLVRRQEVDYKSEIDMVTSVDRESEHAIVEILQAAFPSHSILAEEGTCVTAGSEFRWILDPLDGTTNFVHSYPHFAVSIALEQGGRVVVGVVYDPLREETFTAIRGKGAFLNGTPIRVSRSLELNRSLVATGFPYDRRQRPDYYLSFFRAFMVHTQGIRRNGAAALDMAYVAAGRLDGFWELRLKPWDTAAGALLITEAGGKTSDFEGRPFRLDSAETLASNGKIHEEMLKVIASVLSSNRATIT